MEEKNLTLLPVEELPKTDTPIKKRRITKNCMGSVLREIMDDLKLKDADVVRGTGISWSTFWGWAVENVDTQLTDDNLFNLWVYLNKFKKIHLETLVYGIGEVEELEKEKAV